MCSALPVTNINGIDAKQEAKNRGGIMLILREFPRLKTRNLYNLFIYIFSASSSPKCNKQNIIKAKKMKKPIMPRRSWVGLKLILILL